MAQVVLFTFNAQDVGVAKAQDAIRDRQKEINRLIAEAKKQGSPYDQLIGESIKLKRESEALRDQQAALNREFKQTKVPADSLAGLRLEYSKLIEQVKNLSAAERQSSFGQNLIKQTAGVRQQVSDIEATLGRFTNNVGNYKSAFLSLGNVLTAGIFTGGIAGVASLVGNTFAAFDQQLKVDSQIQAAIKSTGGLAGKTLSDLQQQATTLQKVTLFSDDETEQAQALLLTFTNIRGEIFDRTIPVIQDMSQALGQDLKSSSIQVGKALNDPVKGITALQRVGVSFSESQKKVIKGLVDTGNVTEAQTIILKELETEFGGSARAAAQAGTGGIKLLKNTFNELEETVGGLLYEGLKPMIPAFQGVVEAVNDFLSTPLSVELGNQQREFNALIGVLQDTRTEEGQRNEIIKTLKQEYPQYLKFVNDDKNSQIDLAATLEFGNSLFEKRILLQATEEQRTSLTKKRIDLENELTAALIKQQEFADKGIKATTGKDIAGRAGLGATFGLSQEDQARTAIDRVETVRKQIKDTQNALNDLLKTANATSLRTTGKSLDELQIEISKLFGATGTGKLGADNEGDGRIKILAGSIGFLSAEVQKLQDKINKTPVDSGLLPGLIKDLDRAKEKLDRAKQALLELEFFTKTGVRLAPSPTDNSTAPVLPDIIPELTQENKNQAKDNAKALRKVIQDELQAVEFPVEVKVDPAGQKALDDLQKQVDENDKKNNEKDAARRKKAIEDQKDLKDKLISAAIDAAQSAADAVFGIQKNQIDRELKQDEAKLDAQEQKALAAAQGNATKEAQIKAQFDKKRAEIEKKAAEDRKKIAIKEALINNALAITKALTGAIPPFNFILAGAAAIAGIAQLAIIQSQEFAEGGIAKRLKNGLIRERQNAPRTAKGDTVLAYVRPGEMMLNEGQQAAIAGMAGHDIFERAGVPGASRFNIPVPQFASGGVANFVPQTGIAQGITGGVIVTTAEFSDQQVTTIGRSLGAIIAAEVSTQVRSALANGLDDANRRLEREQILTTQRQG